MLWVADADTAVAEGEATAAGGVLEVDSEVPAAQPGERRAAPRGALRAGNPAGYWAAILVGHLEAPSAAGSAAAGSAAAVKDAAEMAAGLGATAKTAAELELG